MHKYRKIHTSTPIADIKELVSKHLYDDQLDDDDPFFYNIKLDSDGIPINVNYRKTRQTSQRWCQLISVDSCILLVLC